MRFLRGIFALTLACGLLLAVGGAPRPALAASIEVSAEQCSRQGLVDAIETAGAGGVITFDCDAEINFFENDEITITEPLTIDGSNSDGDQIVFNGNDQTRFFHVTSGGNLTLAYVTMMDGHGVGDGGAIWNDGGTVTIFQSSFTGNENGAIFNAGTLTVVQSSFINNHGTYGGAISNEKKVGIATITQSTFTENQAVDASSGGAIYNDGMLDVSQSSFTENQASVGGAIWNGGKLTVSQSSFVKNRATTHGGALDLYGDSAKITSSTFNGNTAPYAGSTVYVHFDAALSTISWSTIIQPADTSVALLLHSDLTLTGVILGGAGSHCDFGVGAVLTDSYTLANEGSCDLTGTGSDDTIAYNNGYENLGLQSPMTIPVNGIDQTLYLPIAVNGLSIDGAPSAACDSGDPSNPRLDQLGNYRPYGEGCTLGAVEFTNLPPKITSLGPDPAHANEGGNVQISAVATAADQTGEPITYAMDCDIADQMPPSLISSFTCGGPDDGVFFGSATVSDGIGEHTRTFIVIVDNVAPVLSPITPDSPAIVNQPVNFQMTATDVPADTITFLYTCSDASDPQASSTISSGDGTFSTTGSCTFTNPGSHTIRVIAIDDDSGISELRQSTVLVGVPTSLCANDWTGSLRVGEDCNRSETMIELPADGPITLCVNDWNGSASLGADCGRSEHQVEATGDGSIAICVNRWNGALRVSDQCSRSEEARFL